MRPGVGLVVAAGLALAGCGDVSPGAAATVDGTEISIETVDDIAQSVCTAEVTYASVSDQDWQPTPTSVYRESVLSLLINEQLALDAAADLGLDVPPSSYEAGDNPQLAELLDGLPASERGPFEDYLAAYSRLQALLVAIGTETGDSGGSDPQAAVAEGQAYLARHARSRDVDIDPRFGTFTDGQVAGGSGSLSVAVDATTEEPRSAEAPPDVSGLPDSQICQ